MVYKKKMGASIRNRFMLSHTLVFIIGWYFGSIGKTAAVDKSESPQLRHASTYAAPELPSGIRKISGGYGNYSWKLVDWQHPISAEEESIFNCEMTTFQSATSHKEVQMCVHAFSDIVSGAIKGQKHWGDCDILPKLWNAGGQYNDTESLYYVEIGANIGSCVMEMLLGTDAKIIAFEPHPMNVYNIKKTVSTMGKSFQDRLMLFPVGLGSLDDTSTIYSASNNMGNSVIGKIIKDGAQQKFDEKLQFTINVERLDSILEAKDIKIKLVKMDAQGFECNVLEGMGDDLAEKIDVVKFEYADHWLHGQGCMDLLPRMNDYGFHIYRKFEDGNFTQLTDPGAAPRNTVIDLFASKEGT